mmetsp:Transcript_59439/g.143486  ORF Transcript_59439/g.143486 Transcript_59439/m.143486 type:complete len:150 (-) Transcript_59439:502-951(-)
MRGVGAARVVAGVIVTLVAVVVRLLVAVVMCLVLMAAMAMRIVTVRLLVVILMAVRLATVLLVPRFFMGVGSAAVLALCLLGVCKDGVERHSAEGCLEHGRLRVERFDDGPGGRQRVAFCEVSLVEHHNICVFHLLNKKLDDLDISHLP